MWRVSLSLITHRFFLLVVALGALHFQTMTGSVDSAGSRSGVSELWSQFLTKVAASPEATAVAQNEITPKDPFLFLGQLLHRFLGLRPELAVLILSNVFLFLFLWELNRFVNSLALPDVAVDTCLLSILWLTSYELSFGSALSLSCYLTILALRSANDHHWLRAGLALGLLALTKLLAVFLIPLLLVVLISQQKYASPDELYKRLVYLFVPLGAAIFFQWGFFRQTFQMIGDSALFNLVDLFKLNADFSWTLSSSYLGQTIALAVMLLGAIISFFVLSTLLHRLLPIVLLLALLITTPYRDLATSALLVAPAFTGIAEACAPPLLKGIQLVFLIFGAIEVFNIFS